MAESADVPSSEFVPAASGRDLSSSSARRKQALAGLAVAAGILVLAWFVAGRAGLGDVGSGGINADLLPKVGQEAPDFVAVSPEGEIVHLSDFRGQPVWLNFWGSWCPPCRAEMPDIQTAYEQLQPQGLTLLAISLGDKPSEAMRFAELNGVTFDILLDPDRTLTSPTYPIYNFPTHIFIDEDGIVRKIVLSEMSSDQAVAAAQSILPESAASKPNSGG
jgi:peroxiredoxin